MTFIANFALSASLNSLWSMINAQQLIIIMPLFDAHMPANVGIFFKQIMQVAAFDVIETEEYINAGLDLPPTDPVNE